MGPDYHGWGAPDHQFDDHHEPYPMHGDQYHEPYGVGYHGYVGDSYRHFGGYGGPQQYGDQYLYEGHDIHNEHDHHDLHSLDDPHTLAFMDEYGVHGHIQADPHEMSLHHQLGHTLHDVHHMDDHHTDSHHHDVHHDAHHDTKPKDSKQKL